MVLENPEKPSWKNTQVYQSNRAASVYTTQLQLKECLEELCKSTETNLLLGTEN